MWYYDGNQRQRQFTEEKQVLGSTMPVIGLQTICSSDLLETDILFAKAAHFQVSLRE